MGLILVDNFALYGGVEANATGPWTTFGGELRLDPDANYPTDWCVDLDDDQFLKKLLPLGWQGVGLAGRVRLSSLPTGPGSYPAILQFSGIGGESAGYDEIMYLYVYSTGHVLLSQGNDHTDSLFWLGWSDQPVVKPEVWQHFEIYYYSTFNGTSTVEVKLEGETIIYADGFSSIQFPENTGNDPSIVGVSFRANDDVFGFGPHVYVKDVVIWHDEGDAPNSFVGPAFVDTLVPTSDVDAGLWTSVGAPSLFAALDNIPYSLAAYASAGAEDLADPCELSLSNITTDWGIIGVAGVAVAQKVDSGYGAFKASVVSGVNVEDSAPFSPAEDVPTMFVQDFSIDPATGSIWTAAALNSASLRLERII